MRDKMKTITSAKELWLSLEQIYKEDDEEDEEKLMKMVLETEIENKMRQSQQLESEEPSNTGKYIGKFLKPHVDFFEKDYHICGKKDNDSEVCKDFENDKLDSDPFDIDNVYNNKLDKLNDLHERVNIENESENENEKSTCYSIGTPGLTNSDFGDDESEKFGRCYI